MISLKANQVTEVRQAMRGGAGEAALTKLLPENPAKARMFTIITLNPGCGIGYHVHENETELFYFIQGTGRVQDDEKIYELSAGDAMSTGGGHGHAVECVGSEPLILLACVVLD